jgi:hypothetical protein
MYFTHEKLHGSLKVTKKVAHLLLFPTINVKDLKFPLYVVTKEPKSWGFSKINNYIFKDKNSFKSFKMDAKSLFQANVRISSQNIQLLLLLKASQKMKETPADSTAATEPADGKQA